MRCQFDNLQFDKERTDTSLSIQPFIHAQHFPQQYQDFWKDPSTVSPLWLSLLFSMLTITSMARDASNMSSSHAGSTGLSIPAFHVAAGQCLVLGNYHRAQPYAPEALVLYAYCVGLKNLDPSREAGVMLSMAVRLAYEMGYHRDPDVFGAFSVFEGEMRRRFWASCKQVDR
jgi:hypothetical protein